MENRIEKLSHGIMTGDEAFLIVSDVNRFYLTGFRSSAGAVFITKQNAYLLVDFRYGEAAKKNVKHTDVIVYDKITDTLKDLCNKHKTSKIYLENDGISLGEANRFTKAFKAFNVKTGTGKTLERLLTNMRLVKSKNEIERIKEAQRITELAYHEILTRIKPGVLEKDIALELEFIMRKNGASAVSFDLITITGEKTSLPHGVPDNTAVKAGDFVTMDIGAVFEGYHSDMTRTVGVSYISEEQEKIYNIVLQAQKNALDTIKAGAGCETVDQAARDVIKQEGFGAYFGHATGHGVGLNIHEKPTVTPGSSTMLSEGMVVTVEPGIYLPGKFGVRIEDMVCVTKNGCINLTMADKKLLVL